MTRSQGWRRLLLVGATYVLAGQLGLALALPGTRVTPFWPPIGIALAAFLVLGRGAWPAVALGAFVLNAPGASDITTPLIITVGNTLAPLLAATLLNRAGFSTRMARPRDAIAIVVVGTTSVGVSAGLGTAALLLDRTPVDAGALLATWWAGDAIGVLTVTPLLLALRLQQGSARPSARRALEAAALLALTATTTALSFSHEQGLRFTVFPVLAVAAARFELRGAAPNAVVAALLASRAAAAGSGPFEGHSTAAVMTALVSFNGCVTFMSYLLATMTSDRQRAQTALERTSDTVERIVRARTGQLSTALDRLTQAQQIARMGSFDVDARAEHVQWSQELCDLVGRPTGSRMALETHLSLCHPAERPQVEAALADTLATGAAFTMDHRLRQADGSYRWLHFQGHAVRDGAGSVVGMRGTATDIHERKTMEGWFAQLVDLAPDSMVFVDSAGAIAHVNVQTEALFGYTRDELLGQPMELLVPDRLREQHAQHRSTFLAAPGARPMGHGLDLRARRKDGSEFPVEVSLSQLDTHDGTLVAAAIRDTTDRQRQSEELAYRGLHDALTGLPNRVLLADRLRQATASLKRQPGHHVAVVFLDLDRFKWVNDSLGHGSGDTLLGEVAARLTAAVRPEDTVARFGGDEFVVVGTGLRRADEALRLAARLREAVTQPVELPGGHTVVPTMSIGVATTDDAQADPVALLRDADAAMYRAKDSGRDRTAVFEPTIHAEMRTRLATAGGLRAAVARDELRVHYQPIVDLETGRPIAVEALVRWQHPERGLLMPGDFLQLAEETGQIGEIDRAVLITACREFGLLAQQHPSLTLNVNVSVQHLSRQLLGEALVRGLAEGGLTPSQLTVEVTESADLSGEEFAQLLATVKELGINVAIDDFGTGFSALSRLNGIGVDRIKVDRSFVRDVVTDSRAQALVAAMTQLAGALDAVVIAEGIEEIEQAAVLRNLGCLGGQGYFWSKPVELVELATWVDRRMSTIRVPAPRAPQLPTEVRSR